LFNVFSDGFRRILYFSCELNRDFANRLCSNVTSILIASLFFWTRDKMEDATRWRLIFRFRKQLGKTSRTPCVFLMSELKTISM